MNQVYSHVLNRRAGIGGASLFRVNHRIHDELTEVILTTQIYVLLVIKASATVKKALTPSGCIQGPCVKQFKNYNMRVSITDTKHQKKKIAGSTATVMLSDMASLQDFCHRVMRDDGSGRYSKYIRPVKSGLTVNYRRWLTSNIPHNSLIRLLGSKNMLYLQKRQPSSLNTRTSFSSTLPTPITPSKRFRRLLVLSGLVERTS